MILSASLHKTTTIHLQEATALLINNNESMISLPGVEISGLLLQYLAASYTTCLLYVSVITYQYSFIVSVQYRPPHIDSATKCVGHKFHDAVLIASKTSKQDQSENNIYESCNACFETVFTPGLISHSMISIVCLIVSSCTHPVHATCFSIK